jgi:cysteine desulfurase
VVDVTHDGDYWWAGSASHMRRVHHKNGLIAMRTERATTYNMGIFSKKRVYLDAASGAEGNPSSSHAEGRAAHGELEAARVRIARLMEVKADDVVFTSGATEANAIAILGLLKAGDHAFYLPSAHASIVENMQLAAARGVSVEALPIKDGRVDIAALKPMLRGETKLISMDGVCGETGTIWNTREVAEAIKGTKILLHVDATQAPLTQKFSRAHFGAGIITLDSSKVGGERGIGALVAHRTLPVSPIIGGGGQERGLRSGTEAPKLATSFAQALAKAAENRETFSARAAAARASLISSVSSISNLFVNEGKEVAPNILNLSLTGRDTDYLVALLDEAGFAVSTKSACESDRAGSRAVLALTGDEARAKSTLRISWNSSTTSADLARFARALSEAVHFLDTAKGAIL